VRTASQTTWRPTNHGGVAPCYWCVTGGRWIRSLPEIRPPPSTSCHFERLSTRRSCRVRPTGPDSNKGTCRQERCALLRLFLCLCLCPSSSASDTLTRPPRTNHAASSAFICTRLQLFECHCQSPLAIFLSTTRPAAPAHLQRIQHSPSYHRRCCGHFQLLTSRHLPHPSSSALLVYIALVFALVHNLRPLWFQCNCPILNTTSPPFPTHPRAQYTPPGPPTCPSTSTVPSPPDSRAPGPYEFPTYKPSYLARSRPLLILLG
jgi:hypothetical protein